VKKRGLSVGICHWNKIYEKFLKVADRVPNETMVDLGGRFQEKGGKSTRKLDDAEVLKREHDENIRKDKEQLLHKEVAQSYFE
jgi:hypothetical protein